MWRDATRHSKVSDISSGVIILYHCTGSMCKFCSSYLHHTARMFSSNTGGSSNFHGRSLFESDKTAGCPSQNPHFGEYTPSPAPLSSGHMPLPDIGDPYITPQPILNPFQRVPWFLIIFSQSLRTNDLNYRAHICTIISSFRPCVNTARLWRCKSSKLRLNAIPSRTYQFTSLI
jgi:hypothetical protein